MQDKYLDGTLDGKGAAGKAAKQQSTGTSSKATNPGKGQGKGIVGKIKDKINEQLHKIGDGLAAAGKQGLDSVKQLLQKVGKGSLKGEHKITADVSVRSHMVALHCNVTSWRRSPRFACLARVGDG